MQDDNNNPVLLERTELNPEKDSVELAAWVPPIKCGGCGGRVDTFYRYNRSDDARCSECGEEWKMN